MRHALALLILVVGISFLPQHARAEWQADGVPLSTVVDDQWFPTIVSDGAGGAIITWEDHRAAPGAADIYVQRVNAAGVPQWTTDGVALSTALGPDYEPQIVADGFGGAIVTWWGGFDCDVYVQRVNAAGVPQWTPDGVALSTDENCQLPETIVSDGAGGAIVAWRDNRNGNFDIYARRVDAAGVPQWTANGVAVCTDGSGQWSPRITTDGSGGAIVTWVDYRNDLVNSTADIYAQRVNAAGAPEWTADGVAVCNAASSQSYDSIVSDGTGGAVITWSDDRPTLPGIYAQRMTTTGAPQWTPNGVALCTAAGNKFDPTIISDGSGGAIITWEDRRPTSPGIYAQWVTTAGLPQWAGDGVALCTAAGGQGAPTIASDGAGGAIVSWQDFRTGGVDIYAQRVDATGLPRWTADGVPVCTAVNGQQYPRIDADGADGAIITWMDRRSLDQNADIYAQRVTDPLNAVAIASFDASATDGVVTLRSAFRSDLGVEAVNVYRAVGTDERQMIVIERVNDIRGDRFEYVDRDVAPGQRYRYRIGVVDGDGEFFSPIVTVSVKAIAASLAQNQPNPFNPTTTIRFMLPVREDVTLAIYDANGHLVRTLVNEAQGFGAHEVTWDGRDDHGAVMGSGVYFYRLRAGKITESKKMVLLK